MNAVPYILGFFAVACYASLTAIAKKLRLQVPPFAFIALTMLMMSVFSGVVSVLYEKEFSLPKLTGNTWIGLICYTLINFVGFALYLNVISKMPVTHYQLLGLIGPVVGGLLAYFILGEAPKPQYLAGLVFIGIGLFIALRKWS